MATEEAAATVGTRGYTSLLQKADVSLRNTGWREMGFLRSPSVAEAASCCDRTVGIHGDGTNTSPNISRARQHLVVGVVRLTFRFHHLFDHRNRAPQRDLRPGQKLRRSEVRKNTIVGMLLCAEGLLR
jgi:hypothetical protein